MLGNAIRVKTLALSVKHGYVLKPRYKDAIFKQGRETTSKKIVKFELQRFIEQTEELYVEDAPTTLPDSGPSYPPAKKKLELFFEDIMDSSSREGKADASIEGVANAEVDRYTAESLEKLECKNPIT